MDKSWMQKRRTSNEYRDGVKAFIEHAFTHGRVFNGRVVKCPCIDCANVKYIDRNLLYEHLICRGIMSNYKVWDFHGENSNQTPTLEAEVLTHNNENNGEGGDDIEGMLHDAFGFQNVGNDIDGDAEETDNIHIDGDAAQFYSLLEETKTELYPGCKNYTKLSFLFRLWQLKCLGGISNKIFTDILVLLKKAFPEGCTLPETFSQVKKLVTDMALDYKKIDACPNDCMLFWKENSDLENCTVCNASRYVKESGIEWVKDRLDGAWRDEKYEMKRKYFTPFSTFGERFRNCPEEIPLESWREAIKRWADEKVAAKAEKNKENRKKLKTCHTGGSKNFAKHAIEIEEDPQREAPTNTPASQVEVFMKTYTKKEGTPITEEARENMEKMRDLVTRATQEGLPVYENGSNSIFAKVMRPERRGFIRCYGKGTPKTVWGESSKVESRKTNEETSNLKKEMEEMKKELNSTKAELDEMRAYFRRLRDGELHVSTPSFSFESSRNDPRSSSHSD